MNKMTDPAQSAGQPRLTEQDLRKRLGDYVAPQGLYDQNKARSFVGKVTCNVDRLVAGQWTEIVLDYEIGASGVADGAWFKATFKFYSDWALFQTVDPAGANYVSAEYHAGALTGVIGVIGPTRMPYQKVISLVQHTSRLLSDLL